MRYNAWKLEILDNQTIRMELDESDTKERCLRQKHRCLHLPGLSVVRFPITESIEKYRKILIWSLLTQLYKQRDKLDLLIRNIEKEKRS